MHTPTRTTSWSYQVTMGVVLLGLVGLGFSRTFFLRPWIETYPVHTSVLWHGAVATSWFVWYPIQALLVARDDVALHRRLGWWGAASGVLSFGSAVAVDFAMVVRGRNRGRDIAAEIDTWSDVVWSNLAPALIFGFCFAVAIIGRRRREVHSRMLLLASIALVDPALARVGLLPDVTWFGIDLDALVFTRLAPFVLPLSLVVRDLRASGGVHPVTGIGVGLLWVVMPLLRTWMPTTALGQQLVLLFA